MNRLDDVSAMAGLDPAGMYGCICDFPELLARSRSVGETWEINPADFAGVVNITLVGMGGSAIGGDLARCLLENKLRIPFRVCRNYRAPEYVGKNSLVIASSYSGNTEETLSATLDALTRGAKVVALTTGGKLGALAKEKNLAHVILEGGLQPRAALPLSLTPLLYFMQKAGFCEGVVNQLDDTVTYLKEQCRTFSREKPDGQNSAKQIARSLDGALPLIYSGPELIESVAVRWRGQMSENGKSLAYSSIFPEMNHNELVGWSDTVKEHASGLCAILLYDEEDHERVTMRLDYFAARLKELDVVVHQAHSAGPNRLARQLSLVLLGDFVSYYLSVLGGVDPTPVEPIENLKGYLATQP